MACPQAVTSICDLPIELLDGIFSCACTDGGYTGRSLSLVSRFINKVVRVLRFRSVALSNFRQTESFLADLTKASAQSCVRVRHLFLSTLADGEEVVRVRNGNAPRWDGLQYYPSAAISDGPQWRVWMVLQEALDKKLCQLLPRLLRVVASDLRTLSIVHSWEFGAVQLPSNMPFLETFTFCGPPPNFPGWSIYNDLVPAPCFPSLRHLHVICWNTSIVSWFLHSPAMTHFRLSDLSSSAYTLIEELQRNLEYGSDAASFLSKARPPLKHVRLQPRGIPLGYYGAGEVEHNLFVWHLKKLHPRDDVRLDVMRERRYHDGYWDARIRQDWMDGIMSGPSWWAKDEELEEDEEYSDGNSDGYGAVDHLVAQWM